MPVTHTWHGTPLPPPGSTTTTVTGSTSTSIPGATTTTLPTPCTTDTDCIDNSGCTEDLCSGGLCSHPPIGGIFGARCALGLFSLATLCPNETIPTKLFSAIDKKRGAASTFLVKADAATTAGKRTKALKKARAAMQAIVTKAAKAGAKRKISAECAAAIGAAATAVRQTIPTS